MTTTTYKPTPPPKPERIPLELADAWLRGSAATRHLIAVCSLGTRP